MIIWPHHLAMAILSVLVTIIQQGPFGSWWKDLTLSWLPTSCKLPIDFAWRTLAGNLKLWPYDHRNTAMAKTPRTCHKSPLFSTITGLNDRWMSGWNRWITCRLKVCGELLEMLSTLEINIFDQHTIWFLFHVDLKVTERRSLGYFCFKIYSIIYF